MQKVYTYRIIGIGPLRGHNGRLGVGSHDGRGGGGSSKLCRRRSEVGGE